jgi:hypothetical protein
MTIEIGKVYTFKFNSGEEMIAKVHSESKDNYIHVSDPLSVAPSAQGVGLIPSLFTADPGQSVTINTNSISMYAEAEDSVKMKYLEATTGIKVPEKKIILG